MKRLLLLPFLMLGFSLACDAPYEEIEGIKIGCPYPEELSNGTFKEDGKTTLFERSLENSFFDSAEIEVLEGNVEGISLSKIFSDLEELKKERSALFESLDEKWGKAVVMGNNESLIVYVNKTPRSEYLDSIVVMSSVLESTGILRVSYTSKKLSH